MKSSLFALTVALMTGAAMPAPAAPPVRPAASGRAAPAVPAVRYERFTLPNGLTALVHTDRTVPTVFVGMWYRTGSKDEPAGKTGFAHLFEHLMFQQTANRQGEYFTPLERAGAVGMNGSTTQDYTNYYQTVPTNALDLALWMESDRMGYLDGGISQAVLDEQRRVVQNEKRQREMQPGADVEPQFLASFYPPNHPYGHSPIGSMADLDAATLDDVRRWFGDRYGASNAVLVLAGDIDVATARAKVTRYFGAMRPGRAFSRPLAWMPSFDAVRRDAIYDATAGASITRTWPLSNEDPRALTLLQLAARTMTAVRDAPLVRALVGDDKVALGVEASVEQRQLGSTFSISVALRPGVAPEQANAALDLALARYLAGGPDADALASVVAGTDSAILRSMDSNAEMANWLVQGEVDHADPLFFLKQRDWITTTTPAEVRTVAAQTLARPYHDLRVLPPPATPAVQIADVDRTRIPEPGPLKTAIGFPPVTEMRLANGMKLVVAERHTLPIVDATMRLDTGTLADRDYAPGAAAAAFELMTAGTARYDAAALGARSSRLGVALSAAAGSRSSSFGWNSATDQLDDAFALAAEALRRPTYPQAAVTAAVAGTQARLARDADAMMSADGLFARAVWGDADPRGRLAQPQDYGRLDRAMVARFHDREIGPANATLLVIGDVTPAQVRTLAERHFGDWRANAPTPIADLPPARPPMPRIVLVDAPGASQSSITVGNVVPAFDREAAAAETLAGAALASQSAGRLNVDLRETKGWTYGFGGGVADQPTGERLFIAGGSVQTDRTADAIATIHGIIGDYVSTRPITAEELESNRVAIARSVPLNLTGSAAFLGAMTSAAAFGLPYDRIGGTADRLSAVTLEQARAAAVRSFRPGALVWVVVGDLKAIEPGVRALGIAPVEIWDAAGGRIR